jgi:hypothetical protein
MVAVILRLGNPMPQCFAATKHWLLRYPICLIIRKNRRSGAWQTKKRLLRRTGIFKLFWPRWRTHLGAMTMAQKFVINIADEAFNAYLSEGEFIDAVNEFAADLINAAAVGQVGYRREKDESGAIIYRIIPNYTEEQAVERQTVVTQPTENVDRTADIIKAAIERSRGRQ